MFKEKYARWMYEWETRLTTRDENRVVRPLEWGFEWIEPFLETHGFGAAIPGPEAMRDDAAAEAAMARINQLLIRHSDVFFGYERPTDFRLEERHPELFPTNVRPETLAKDAEIKRLAAEGKLRRRSFCASLRPSARRIPKTTWSMRAGIPRPQHKDPKRPKQAIVVMPQWNADAFSHNSLVHNLQSHGHLCAAAVQALPRHSPARGTGALRLRRQRQHRPHALSLPPGRGRHSLLHRLA